MPKQMKVTIALVYGNPGKETRSEKTLTIPASLRGLRLTNAIDAKINKEFKSDKDWKRWELLSIKE